MCGCGVQVIRSLVLRKLARRQLQYLARLNWERVVDIADPQRPVYYFFNHQTGWVGGGGGSSAPHNWQEAAEGSSNGVLLLVVADCVPVLNAGCWLTHSCVLQVEQLEGPPPDPRLP